MSDTTARARERARAQRNLHPHAEAVAAMWLFGKRYSEQRGGSMDFWDALSASDKELCQRMVRDIRAAASMADQPKS